MTVGAHIVNEYTLHFDPASPENGSLYLCVQEGTGAEAAIAALRSAGLWSAEPHKTVAPEQRAKYAEQMQFVACAQFATAQGNLLAARYTHPKFPSSAARWQAWLTQLAAAAGHAIFK